MTTPSSIPGSLPVTGTTHRPGSVSLIGVDVGHYRVTRELGRGGMGMVYEAVHQSIGQKIAVKVLFPEYSENSRHLQRFFDEARAVNIVHHPGLVKVYDYGQLQDGTAYITMELLEGESLQARISRMRKAGTRMEIRKVLQLARQVASALSAVHAKGIAHRDLKPPNIFVVPDREAPEGERAKVLDFGIAKFFGDTEPGSGEHLTTTGKLLGTPAYMSPEQCGGADQVDDRTDVYALGIILYQMISGHLPFQADALVVVMSKHISEQARPLSELRPDCPRPIVDLVHAMLLKSKAERISMEEVTRRLEALLSSELRAPLPRWVRPALALASSALLLAGSGYLVISQGLLRRGPKVDPVVAATAKVDSVVAKEPTAQVGTPKEPESENAPALDLKKVAAGPAKGNKGRGRSGKTKGALEPATPPMPGGPPKQPSAPSGGESSVEIWR